MNNQNEHGNITFLDLEKNRLKGMIDRCNNYEQLEELIQSQFKLIM